MNKKVLIVFLGTVFLISGLVARWFFTNRPIPAPQPQLKLQKEEEAPKEDPNYWSTQTEEGKDWSVRLVNATFLNNAQRNYYGNSLPDSLRILWRHYLGQGKTRVGKEWRLWAGAGWTGQPLMVEENGVLYLIQGAYDHRLKKINAETGELVWQYKFDDVIKGTGTICIDRNARNAEESVLVLQGSRAGASLASKRIFSYRAISLLTGKEQWRMNSARTRCYSRDVDASALYHNDTAYIGLENGIFTVFSPSVSQAIREEGDTFAQVYIYRNEDTLFVKKDIAAHGGNLVTECSPSLLDGRIYLASGSGHVWGYNIAKKEVDWDFFIGSDIDGSPVVTADSCLLISVEKQYIKGKGGLLKLNPRKRGKEAVEWYYPTEDMVFASWLGGIIGTASINSLTKEKGIPSFAVFSAIDGFMYVVDLEEKVANDSVLSFDAKHYFSTPKLLFKYKTGPSISTPIVIGNKIIMAGYNGLYKFSHNDSMQFQLDEQLLFNGKPLRNFESSPFVHNKRMYIASRDGFLYCIGDYTKKDSTTRTIRPDVNRKRDSILKAQVKEIKKKEKIKRKEKEETIDSTSLHSKKPVKDSL